MFQRTTTGEAELPTSARFMTQQCSKKKITGEKTENKNHQSTKKTPANQQTKTQTKRKETSNLIYSLAIVKMKSWAVVFRHNRQLLKEIKRRSRNSSQRLSNSLENGLSLHPSGISTTQLRLQRDPGWQGAGLMSLGFWELNSFTLLNTDQFTFTFSKITNTQRLLSDKHAAGKESLSGVAQRIGKN